jgi:hypothetical protein
MPQHLKCRIPARKSPFLFCLLPCAAFAADTGVAASGLVVDPMGKGVSGAIVIARRIPAAAVSAAAPFRFVRLPADSDHMVTATTGRDGSFILNGLSAARYSICAESSDRSFLNTCTWSGDYVRDMSTREQRTELRLVLEPAAVVTIDIRDPDRLLSVADARFGTGVVVGVRSAANDFYPATLINRDEGGQHFSIAVPLERALQLWVFSRSVRFLDPDGRELNAETPQVPFQARTQVAPPAFTLRALRR